MKLLVLGATGATGRLVVDQALAAGHSVRALVRSPQKITADHPALEVVTGQATDVGDVSEAMTGREAVISTLGDSKGTVVARATHAIITGAEAEAVSRVVLLSSFLVLRGRLSSPIKAISGMAMGALIQDRIAAEELLRSSGLSYTVVYPVRLTNGPATGGARIAPETETLRVGDSISRTDVAAWLLAAATGENTASRRAVALTV